MRIRLKFVVIYFFKQKSAYDMRISDWSSDVCSSDLIVIPLIERGRAAGGFTLFSRPSGGNADDRQRDSVAVPNMPEPCGERVFRHSISARSEEHTSELQSLMRISYAVFCLKKKKKQTDKITTKEHRESIKAQATRNKQ